MNDHLKRKYVVLGYNCNKDIKKELEYNLRV